MLTFKNLCFMGAIVLGSFAMFYSSASLAQGAGPLPGDWICCAANSSGCTDRLGDRWDTDERRVGTTCTIGASL